MRKTIIESSASAPSLAARLGGGVWSSRTFSSLQEGTYRWFVLAMLGHQASMNMMLTVRGFVVFDLTGSYAALGAISLAVAIPMLLLATAGGVIADRLARKRVVQMGQAVAGLNSLLIAVVAFSGHLSMEILYVNALIQGATMALMMPSRQAIIPSIISPGQLMNAISLNAAGMNLMRLIAPAVGGFLVAFAGPEWAFLAMTLLGAWSVMMLTPVKTPAHLPAAKRGTGLSDLREGLAYALRDRVIFVVLVMNIITATLAMPYLFMLPGFVDDVFDKGADILGLMIAVSGAGALVGALVLASLPERHRGLLFLLSAVTIGVGLLLFAISESLWISMGLMVVIGVGSAGRQALGQVLLQSYVQDDYRGRVMAIYMMQISMVSLGAFLIGLLSEAIGVQAAFAVLGIGLLTACALIYVLAPRLRSLH